MTTPERDQRFESGRVEPVYDLDTGERIPGRMIDTATGVITDNN